MPELTVLCAACGCDRLIRASLRVHIRALLEQASSLRSACGGLECGYAVFSAFALGLRWKQEAGDSGDFGVKKRDGRDVGLG